jgi:hypothetical protein
MSRRRLRETDWREPSPPEARRYREHLIANASADDLRVEVKRLEVELRELQETLRDQKRRWNLHSTRLTMAGVKASGRDMDDAVYAIDAALAASSEEPG